MIWMDKNGLQMRNSTTMDIYAEATEEKNKKFVRYREGANLYSMGISKFQKLAKEAKAIYKINQMVLVNT